MPGDDVIHAVLAIAAIAAVLELSSRWRRRGRCNICAARTSRYTCDACHLRWGL